MHSCLYHSGTGTFGHSGFCIGYVNPHVCNMAETEPVIGRFINQCDLVCIDGLATALALKGTRHNPCRNPVHRVVALNLFDDLLTQTSHGLVRKAKSLGIKTHMTVVLGLRGETRETLQRTFDF